MVHKGRAVSGIWRAIGSNDSIRSAIILHGPKPILLPVAYGSSMKLATCYPGLNLVPGDKARSQHDIIGSILMEL